MTGLLIGVAAWAGLVAVGVMLIRAGDHALADLGTDDHDPDCLACHAANDPVMERFDMNLWSIEMQERQP